VLCLLSATAFAPRVLAAKAKPAMTDPDLLRPALELSPFEVTARSLEFDHWIRISSPHFVIYTDASTKEATATLKHLEMVHQVAQSFLHRKGLNRSPMIVVLPTGRSDWGKIATRGKVEWHVATSLVDYSRNLLLVQYDWQSDGLDPMWTVMSDQEMNDMNLDGPLWLRRGVGHFFATVTFDKDTLTIGKESFYPYYLKQNGWMNWQRFFSVTTRSPEFFKDSTLHEQYEGQCAVFIHYLLTNADPASLTRLIAWSAYLDAGNEPTPESFKEVFGQDWTSLQAQIDKMLDGGKYTTNDVQFPPSALDFDVVSANPTAREMRELFVLCQILNRDTKDSDLSLEAILAQGLKTESLRDLLADACHRRERTEAALREFRTIIDAGTTNPLVYAHAAQLLFWQTVPENSLDARFPDETGEVHRWARQALTLEPLDVNANETLAWAEAYAPKIEKSNLDEISRICRTLDQNARTDEALMAMAVARWRSGGVKQARSLCGLIAGSPFSRKSVKKLAAELLARLEQGY